MNGRGDTATLAQLVKDAESEGMRVLDAHLIGEPTKAESVRLGALSRSAAIARIAASPDSWVVKEIIAALDYGTLAGPKGVGKTLALEDLAVSVGLGEPWFGRWDTDQQRVLLLTCEDPEPRTWARLDAICRWKDRDPAELEGWVFVHPLPFSAIHDIDRLRAELSVVEPGLVILDPAYKYLAGANSKQIFDMGQVLTPIQVACQEQGAALLVGHHYNRKEGAAREERITGAGILEWARVVITMDAPPRRAGDHASVMMMFEVTGNSLDPTAFSLRRTVQRLDDSANPELLYMAEVVAEGTQVQETRYLNAAGRVLAVLPFEAVDALTVREIGDRVANDETGRGGIKAATIRRALTKDLELQVDTDGSTGREGRWWRL